MAKRRKKRTRRKRGPIPILPLLGGVVAPLAKSFGEVGGLAALESNPECFIKGMIDQVTTRYSGFHVFPELAGTNKFNLNAVMETYGGLVLGVAGSKLADKFGVNRQIARIPVIGGKIKL